MMGQHVGVIERAFELARHLASLEAIGAQLRREGHSNVEAHLSGKKIRSDLAKIITQMP